MKIVTINQHIPALPQRANPKRPPVNVLRIPKAKPAEPSGTYTLAKRGRSVKREPAP